jgi:anti-sigma B factor antagonist
MHLEIQQREREGVAILDVKGKLVLGPEDLSLRAHLTSLLSDGVRNVILNLKDVTHVDTAGVGTLVLSTEKFRSAGGRMAIVHLNPTQASVANILKLDSELDVYPDEQDAVNGFFPERAVPHFDILELVEENKLRASEQDAEKKK